MMNKLTIPVLFFLFSFPAIADDGWNSIKQNDHKKAREIFTSALEKDSLNIDAMKGMIILSEIEQDHIAYSKFINRIIYNFNDEFLYSIFASEYEGKVEAILKKTGFSEKVLLSSKIRAADILKEKRQFNESIKAYQELFTDYKWSVIGPFKNISGSGHRIEYDIEKEPFREQKIYKNEKGAELFWVKPKYRNNNGEIDFEDYLPANYDEGVYYANTFIDVPEAMTVQLRIARSSPVKIWIDDCLVYKNNEKIHFGWDNEIIEVSLAQGNHRILIKNSTLPDQVKSYEFLHFNDGGGYSYQDDDEIYSFSGHYSSLSSGEKIFSVRITDTKGILVKKITPSFSSNYKPGVYPERSSPNTLNTHFKEEINKTPEDLFSYYALMKSCLQSNSTRQEEEIFIKAYRKNSNIVFFKYLAAKIYAENGKIEKAYGVLNNISHDTTPIFGLLYERFKDIDLDNDEARYMETLGKLKKITPSSYMVINAYIRYYNKKGMRKEKEDFITEMKTAYPTYSKSLDNELENSEKPYKAETDKEKEEEVKSAMKSIKTKFITSDYLTLINHYKQKGNPKKVLSLYNELITRVPYSVYFRKDKARYLFSEEKYQDALKEYREVLTIAPFEDDIYESIGDVYSDLGKTNKDTLNKALNYYFKAKKYGKGSYRLKEKIEKIAGSNSQKKLFSTKTFDDILKDPQWAEAADGEESMILMYTRDIAYDSMASISVFQQMMIQIITETGAKNWTEFDFSFIGNINMIKVIKKNGAEIVPDNRNGYVVFKNLEPGDLIQLDGVYEWDQMSEMDKEFFLLNYLTFEAPIYYNKFEVAVPKGQYLGYLIHHMEDKLVRSTRNNYDYFTWEYFTIPKVEREDAIVDDYDLYSNIMISTLPDWSKVVEWYDKITYRKLEITYEVREVMDSIIKPTMSEKEKAMTIYNFITREIKYSYVPFLQSGYVPKQAGLTLSAKIGDCKDVATLMMVMLKHLGIECYYTLVKTNQFNHQDILPSIYFDHVVVCCIIDGKKNYYDLTTDFYPHYVLTENDIDAIGLTIKKGETSIFRLPSDDLDSTKNLVHYDVDAKMNPDKSLELKINATHPGLAGGSIREISSSTTPLEMKNYVTDMIGKGVFENINLTDNTFDNMAEISAPLTSHYTVNVSDFSDEVANLLICRIPYITAIQPSPVISAKSRHNRINIEGMTRVEPTLQKINIKFPKGYSLVQVPKNISISSKYGTYRITFKKTEGGLYVEKYQSFKTKIVDEKEFQEFKDYYSKLLNADKTKIAVQLTEKM